MEGERNHTIEIKEEGLRSCLLVGFSGGRGVGAWVVLVVEEGLGESCGWSGSGGWRKMFGFFCFSN